MIFETRGRGACIQNLGRLCSACFFTLIKKTPARNQLGNLHKLNFASRVFVGPICTAVSNFSRLKISKIFTDTHHVSVKIIANHHGSTQKITKNFYQKFRFLFQEI